MATVEEPDVIFILSGNSSMGWDARLQGPRKDHECMQQQTCLTKTSRGRSRNFKREGSGGIFFIKGGGVLTPPPPPPPPLNLPLPRYKARHASQNDQITLRMLVSTTMIPSACFTVQDRDLWRQERGLLLHVTNSSLHHGYDVIGSLGSTEMMSSLIDSDVM